MTFREDLETRYTADTRGFDRGAGRVERRLGQLDGTIRSRLDRIDRRWERSSRAVEGFRGVIGKLAVGVGLASFARQALTVAGNFEAAMNRVRAASGATAQQIDALAAKARELGQTTSFSASEAAAGIEMLVRNGLGVEEILGGALDASLKLASATGGDLARAADLATDLMGQFGIEASRLGAIVDTVTGGVVRSKFGFSDFSLAIGQGGAVAAQAGVELDEFVTAIAATSSAFASGSDAGTSYKTFVTRLVGDSKQARAAIDRLGLQFFDAAGNLRPMREIAGELQGALAGLSEEARTADLKTIFGTDAIRTAAALAEQGAAGFDAMAQSIGLVSAADQAEARMAGFEGAARRVSAAWEGVLLAVGESGGLDASTAALEGLAVALNALAENMPEIATGIATLAGTRGFLMLRTALNASRQALVQNVDAAERQVRVARAQALAARQAAARKRAEITALNAQTASSRALERAKNSLTRATVTLDAAERQHIRAVGTLSDAKIRMAQSATLAGRSMGALRGAMGFFGGPIGLAVTALTVGITALAGSASASVPPFEAMASTLQNVQARMADFEAAANRYQSAIGRSAGAQVDASNKIIAATKKEFEAKKTLLELDLQKLRAAAAESAARVSTLEERLQQRIDRRDRNPGRVNKALNRDIRERDTELRGLRAEMALTEAAMARFEEATSKTFDVAPSGSTTAPVASAAPAASSGRAGAAPRQSDPFGDSADRVQALDAEIAAVGKLGAELYFLEERERVMSALRAEGVNLSPQMVAQAEALASVYAEQRQRLDGLQRAERLLSDYRRETQTTEEKKNELLLDQIELREQLIALGQSDQGAAEIVEWNLRRQDETMKRLTETGRRMGSAVSRAFEDIVTDIDNAEDAAKRLLASLVQIALEAALSPVLEGLGTSLAGSLGFASGGYTGDGGRYEPAGVVHRGEYVVRAPYASRYRPLLEQFNRGRIPGYSAGGFVSGPLDAPAAPRLPAIPPAGGIQMTSVTHIEIHGDRGDVLDRLRPELDRRDANLRRDIPAAVARRNRHDPGYLV